MNKQIQFRIEASVKELRGTLGAKIRRREEFWFCCESASIARGLASGNVKSKGYPFEEISLQIVEAIPVSTEVFPAQHAPLKSLCEVQSEVDEMEFA